MNNFYRSFNVNGNPHVWVYTDDAGELQFVPCDKQGWVDPVVMPVPTRINPNGVHFSEMVLTCSDGDVLSDMWVGDCLSQAGINYQGWQPMPEVMESKA